MSETIQKPGESSAVIKQNLNEYEASAEYGMSVHFYRRSRLKGDGPSYIKLDGAVLYPRRELDKFYNSRLVKSTAEATIRKSSVKRG